MTGALVERVAPHAQVRYAATPYQGWQAAQCAMPDVLIIDPGPHLGSTLLLQLCQETWPQMQVVVLTLTPVAQGHAGAWIDKSVPAPALVDTLRTLIHNRGR